MSDHDRLRERAYRIWEREGRPHGRDAEHWDQALREEQDASEDVAPVSDQEAPAAVAAPEVAKAARKPRARPTAEAEAPATPPPAAPRAAPPGTPSGSPSGADASGPKRRRKTG